MISPPHGASPSRCSQYAEAFRVSLSGIPLGKTVLRLTHLPSSSNATGQSRFTLEIPLSSITRERRRVRKPLGIKSYGSIPHLPGSRLGPGDHKCHEGQERIATVKTRDRHDEIIVLEKLDGSNVAIARVNGVIFALTRAGYIASTSPYEQHHHFEKWVMRQQQRFFEILKDGERLNGEWLMQAHGTRYKLPHEPFVAFDLMTGAERMPYDEVLERINRAEIVTPHLLHRGAALSTDNAMRLLNVYGFHGALDPVEGAVWRVERNELIHPNRSERRRIVDFLVKYVRPDKIDGVYLPEVSGNDPVFNWEPPRGRGKENT